MRSTETTFQNFQIKRNNQTVSLQSILQRGGKPLKVPIKGIRHANTIWWKLFTVFALALFITKYIYYNPLTITSISKSEANNDNSYTATEENYYPQQVVDELMKLLSGKDYYTFNDKLNDKFNMQLTALNVLNTLNNSLIISCGDSIIRYMTETFSFIFSHIDDSETIPNNSIYKHYINILYDQHYYKYGYKPHIFSYRVFDLNIDIIMVTQPKHYQNLNEMYKVIENGQYINKYMLHKSRIIVIHDFVGLHSLHLIPFVYHFAMDKSLTFHLEYYLQQFFNFIIYNFQPYLNQTNVYIFYRNTNPICTDAFYGKWNIAQREYAMLLNELQHGILPNENIENHPYIQKCLKHYEFKELNNTVINIRYNQFSDSEQHNISLNGYDICIKNTIVSNLGVDLWNERLKQWVTYKQKQLILPNRFQLIYYDSHNILKSFYGTCNDTKFHQKDGLHFNGLYLTDLYAILNYINYFESN